MNYVKKEIQSVNASTLDEILKIFLGIDEKIMQLHKCSSDDFLSLNKVLKENYEKARFITQNAALTFVKTGEEGGLRQLDQLNNALTGLEKDLSVMEEEMNRSLVSLELIEANLSLMFMPLNNFRQNLNALKLLLSNIKLTNTFKDRSLKSFSDQEAQRVEGIINKVKDSCPVFEENIYNIQKHVQTVYQDLTQLKDVVFSDLSKKTNVLRVEFSNIQRLYREALKSSDKVEEISRNCNKSVGSIITNLQYHDIIRQKMEHIQNTHKLIIDEIDSNEGKKTQISHNPFLLQIPQITEIQVAQLLHTNKEYQGAIEHISTKMIEIGSDMISIARICKSLCSFDPENSHLSWDNLSDTFSEFIKENEICLNKYNTVVNEIYLGQKITAELFDKFKDLEMMENAIEQRIIDKISFGNLLISEENDTASQAQQILKLYAANHFEKNKLRTLFENTQSILQEFRQRNTAFINENKGLEAIHAMLDLCTDQFDKLEENVSFVDTTRANIIEKSKEIEKAGSDVVGKLKYYDFFDKTIDEVIARFDSINLLVGGDEHTDMEAKLKSLEQIENYYTMKSERIIHNQALLRRRKAQTGEDLIEIAQDESNHEGNDVEFF